MLGGFGGMGQSFEALAAACLSGRYVEHLPAAATDPAARLTLLDADGIAQALLYPSLGLQWEGEVDDPAYALAHTRAYNRWIEEFCAGSGGRLVPIAHLTLGDPAAAATELRRAVRAGARGGFLLPFTLTGCRTAIPRTTRCSRRPRSSACRSPSIPASTRRRAASIIATTGSSGPTPSRPGHLVSPALFPQAVQQAFSTFFLYATFDRFPAPQLVVLESGAGWLGFWMDRMDALHR